MSERRMPEVRPTCTVILTVPEPAAARRTTTEPGPEVSGRCRLPAGLPGKRDIDTAVLYPDDGQFLSERDLTATPCTGSASTTASAATSRSSPQTPTSTGSTAMSSLSRSLSWPIRAIRHGRATLVSWAQINPAHSDIAAAARGHLPRLRLSRIWRLRGRRGGAGHGPGGSEVRRFVYAYHSAPLADPLYIATV